MTEARRGERTDHQTMKIRFQHLLLALCVAGATGHAQAQVMRCTDARTGQVTYTDGACSGGAAVREVEARKTPDEIMREREQAAQALALKQQRLQAENTAAETEALRNAERDRARAAQTAATAPRPQDYARSSECARSRRNLEVVLSSSSGATYEQSLRVDAAQRQVDLDCLGPEGYARSARTTTAPQIVVAPPYYPVRPPRSPVQPPVAPKPQFTQCNVFRCYDSQGNSHPR